MPAPINPVETDMVSSWHLKRASSVVRNGGIIAYPTEAVYGLGCDPLNAETVLRLLELKQRDPDKGLILIASNMGQLQPYLAPLAANVLRKVKATWPGPVTWLLPARPETPWWIRGRHETIAVRVTAHPLASALCEAVGHALVSTSANISNRPPARNPLSVQRIFGDEAGYIVHGDTGGLRKPTEIRDAVGGWTVRKG
jgi:L-threonylcarbamoyladenylate synthase